MSLDDFARAVMMDHAVVDDVLKERRAQDRKWGEQNHSDGTGGDTFEIMREHSRSRCQALAADGTVTWEAIATEEYFEALAETDEEKLETELIQLQAVLTAWVGCIRRRRK
jgi:hypothetical protein